MTSATGLLGRHAHFLHWGVVQISLANLTVILLMLLVFALAILVPFPHARENADQARSAGLDVPDVHA
jgi:hypothetical protein